MNISLKAALPIYCLIHFINIGQRQPQPPAGRLATAPSQADLTPQSPRNFALALQMKLLCTITGYRWSRLTFEYAALATFPVCQLSGVRL